MLIYDYYPMIAKSEETTHESCQNILKGINIPPQPQILLDIKAEMASPAGNLSKIAGIISKDIGISGSVLKVVNSPFFGLRNKVTSIQQALNLLGSANIVNIVNSLSLRNNLSSKSIKQMTTIWDSAMDIAMTSAAISKLIKVGSADEAYSLGLFHNCGILLLMEKFDNYLTVLTAAYASPEHLITDIENEKIECNHAVVGYYVAKAWKLPNHLCDAIADHHKTGAIFSDTLKCDKAEKNLLAVLKLAEHCCQTYLTLGNANYDYEFERIKSDLLAYVGLSEYDLDDLLSEIKDMDLTV